MSGPNEDKTPNELRRDPSLLGLAMASLVAHGRECESVRSQFYMRRPFLFRRGKDNGPSTSSTTDTVRMVLNGLPFHAAPAHLMTTSR